MKSCTILGGPLGTRLYRIFDIAIPISKQARGGETKTSEYRWNNNPRHYYAWEIFAILAVVAATVAISAFFYTTRPAPVPGTYYPFFWFPFPLFFIFGFFFLFWIVRWLFFPWRGGWGYGGWGYRRRYWRYSDESYYILRERYARGDITKDQYEQMMRDLQQHNGNQPSY